MLSFVKKKYFRIFVGKNYSSVKKNSRQKNSSLAKAFVIFADFFSLNKVFHMKMRVCLKYVVNDSSSICTAIYTASVSSRILTLKKMDISQIVCIFFKLESVIHYLK